MGFIVPLTKGDSREAAGGQGLSHFYHGLQAPPLPRRGICANRRPPSYSSQRLGLQQPNSVVLAIPDINRPSANEYPMRARELAGFRIAVRTVAALAGSHHG